MTQDQRKNNVSWKCCFIFVLLQTKCEFEMRVFEFLRSFKKMYLCKHSNVGHNYVAFNITPSLGFEWDTQCRPFAENGKIVMEGQKELTLFFEWLGFFGGICFVFDWIVKNPEDFEEKKYSEDDLKTIETVWEELYAKDKM